MSTTEETCKLIHIAHIFNSEGRRCYLLLRKEESNRFTWFKENKENNNEAKTDLSAHSIEEALRIAAREWRNNSFTYINSGFRYSLPERDEHGINALFHQMIASYSSMNGVYYDEELGCNCFVQNASHEAYDLWQKLKEQKRLFLKL